MMIFFVSCSKRLQSSCKVSYRSYNKSAVIPKISVNPREQLGPVPVQPRF